MLQNAIHATIIAQATTAIDPISGGAGWVGAGLLGLVLGWLLLVHLPAKDKMITTMVADKDKALTDKDAAIALLIKIKDENILMMMTRERETVQKLTTEFREALKQVVDHCQEEARELRTLIK